MCRHQTTKTRLVSQAPCNASNENYSSAGKLSLKIQVSKLDFHIGLGLYVGSSHPRIRPEIVKPPCTLLIFNCWDGEKNIYMG